MSAPQFTSGPWEATRCATTYYSGPEDAGDPCIVTAPDDGVILAVCVPDVVPQMEANARLIAAAPELYEALEWILKIATTNIEQDEKLRAQGARTLNRIADRAEDALAKAGGEQ